MSRRQHPGTLPAQLLALVPSGFRAWTPPPGWDSISHPRSISDILLRSTIIHAAAYLAYWHLTYILSRGISHTSRPAQIVHILLPFCAILLPEFIPIQLGLWLATTALGWTWDGSRERAGGPEREAMSQGGIGPPTTVFKHTLLLASYLLLLCAALRGYYERLQIRYHDAFYVGNLGLDHRNGWTAVSGILSAAATATILLSSSLCTAQAHSNSMTSPSTLEKARPRSSSPKRSSRRCRMTACACAPRPRRCGAPPGAAGCCASKRRDSTPARSEWCPSITCCSRRPSASPASC